MNYICIHCGNSFRPNPRVKNQRYCSEKSCQKARRARWQRDKMANDPDYKENQQRCWEAWIRAYPGYYKDYRTKRPEYVERNRLLQMMRDAKRGKDKVSKLLAKMDSLIVKLIPCKRLGTYG